MVGGVNAALANYSKALAGQGLIDDVNVNRVSPGQMETERLQGLLETRARDENKTIDEVRAERMSHEGIRRLGRPVDTAALVSFLCATKHATSMAPGSVLMVVLQKGAFDGFFTHRGTASACWDNREFVHRSSNRSRRMLSRWVPGR